MYGELYDDLYKILTSKQIYRIFSRGDNATAFKPNSNQKTILYKKGSSLGNGEKLSGNRHIDGNLMQLALFAYYNIARTSLSDKDFTKLIREENLTKQLYDNFVQVVRSDLNEEIDEILQNNHFESNHFKKDCIKYLKANTEVINQCLTNFDDIFDSTQNDGEIISDTKKAIIELSKSNSSQIAKEIKYIQDNYNKIKIMHNLYNEENYIHLSLLSPWIQTFICYLDEAKCYLEHQLDNFFNNENDYLLVDILENIYDNKKLSDLIDIAGKDDSPDNIRKRENEQNKHDENLKDIQNKIKDNLNNVIQIIESVISDSKKLLGKNKDDEIDFDILIFAFIAYVNNILFNSSYYGLSTLTSDTDSKVKINERELPIKFAPNNELLKLDYQELNMDRINLLSNLLHTIFPEK